MTGRILDASNPDALLASMGLRAPDFSGWIHPCAGGCGEKMLHPGTCGDCLVRERAEKERDADRRKRLETIPPRYRDARFGAACLHERVGDTSAFEAARTALSRHLVLVLIGPPGVGKSTVAGAALAAEGEAGKSIAWIPALRLAVARSEGRLGSEPAEIHAALRAQVTVIDDLGQEALTTTSAVADVVSGRHDAQRSMIVTSGLSRRDLGTRYGGGIGRRLLEGACVVEMTCRRSP